MNVDSGTGEVPVYALPSKYRFHRAAVEARLLVLLLASESLRKPDGLMPADIAGPGSKCRPRRPDHPLAFGMAEPRPAAVVHPGEPATGVSARRCTRPPGRPGHPAARARARLGGHPPAEPPYAVRVRSPTSLRTAVPCRPEPVGGAPPSGASSPTAGAAGPPDDLMHTGYQTRGVTRTW